MPYDRPVARRDRGEIDTPTRAEPRVVKEDTHKQPMPIVEQMERLEYLISRLDRGLNELEARISPILSPNSSDSNSKGEPRAISSQLTDTLCTQNGRLANLADCITGMIDRLEI